VPEPVCAGQIAGEPYFAERAVSGVSLAKVVRLDTRATFVPMAESFLVALNTQPAGQQGRLTQVRAASQFAAPVMARVLPLVQDNTLRERAAALFEHSLAGAVYRPGLLHGDYGVSNILVSEARLSGVIDWENAQHAAPPVLDAFNYLDSVQRWCSAGLTLADTVPMLARGEWPIPEELAMLRRALARDGIPERYLRGFALLYWVRHLSAQLEFWRSNEALTQRVRDVLSRLTD
jgi:aminoglycoside phosphotransferase (APT) family kinase protein